jgi:capsular exopolysaccharide synthesis family protein
MATERIKRALDLARAQRDGRSSPYIRTLPDRDPPSEEAAEHDDSEPAVELTGRFLRTRELTVDAEHLRRGRLISPSMEGEAAQSFRMLRTQVMQRLRARSWNSLAIVSTTPDEGKTTVALNLAMAIAMDASHSALLVDFDLRKPSVAKRLGIEVQMGVEDVLAGSASVDQAFVRLAGYERLMVLPAAAPVMHSSELISGPSARKLVTELKSRYADRIVIFDLPPLLGADDALAFLPNVDAVLLVVAEGKTKAEHLQRALELMKDKPIVGTVLNRSRSATEIYCAY